MCSVRQAAQLMGLSPQHLRQLLQRGEVKGKKIGNTWVVLSLEYQGESKGSNKPASPGTEFTDLLLRQIAQATDPEIIKGYKELLREARQFKSKSRLGAIFPQHTAYTRLEKELEE